MELRNQFEIEIDANLQALNPFYLWLLETFIAIHEFFPNCRTVTRRLEQIRKYCKCVSAFYFHPVFISSNDISLATYLRVTTSTTTANFRWQSYFFFFIPFTLVLPNFIRFIHYSLVL